LRQILVLTRRIQRRLIAAALILGVIILVVWFVGGTFSYAPEDTALQDDQNIATDSSVDEGAPTLDRLPEEQPTAAALVVVYISGAVEHPDVYQVPAAARVKDVVAAAGGFTDDAAVDRINLADHVVDAQHIHVLRLGEPESEQAPANAEESSANKAAVVNINTASAAELDQSLDDVGPVLAQRIIEYRTTNGPFQSVEDLRKVKGIGPTLFTKLSSHITVGP